MDDRRKTLRIGPTIWLSLAVCLAFPAIWNALLPRHVGEPIAVVLTPPVPADMLVLPPDRIDARPGPRRKRDETPWATFAFDLGIPGRYSLYGIASDVRSRPLELSIDEVLVSDQAFYPATGSLHDHFQRHRIATGVALGAGTHTVKLAGHHVFGRTLALELQREIPLGPGRYALLAAGAALLLGLRWLVTARLSMTPRRRLAATAVFAIGVPALALLALAAARGPALSSLDRSDTMKSQELAKLEAYLASQTHRTRGDRFSVAILGDSTHFWALETQAMLPSIETALGQQELELVELYGVAGLAFSAYDFYLLLNRLVDEQPDLVVIPVNLRSFGDPWIESGVHDFDPIERYLRIDELPFAHGAALGPRRLEWPQLLLLRFDASGFGAHISRFLRGLRRFLRTEAGLEVRKRSPDWLVRPLPQSARQRTRPAGPAWPDSIPTDHPMLHFFRLTNRLAERHGVKILYYTTQANVEELAKTGRRVDLPRRYGEIGRAIGGDPGVSFLDLSHTNPTWMFVDDSEHLTRSGMRAVAENLARAILELRDGRGI